MFTKYFGNYLFEANRITLEQFKNALQQLPVKRARLGVLAIEAGYMTAEQVESTHAAQLRLDRKFGELAIDSGYLMDEQLETLLSRQSSPFSVFSQILCDEGYMTYTRLSKHLESYRKLCGMSEESFMKFKNGDIEPMIRKVVSGSLKDNAYEKIASSYVEVFVKNVMRFISAIVTLDTVESGSAAGGKVKCRQIIKDEYFSIVTAFSGSVPAMLYFSNAFSKRQFSEFNEMARDILGEFLNCSNGIFISNMFEDGLKLDLEPQEVTADTEREADTILCIPITIDDYTYQLALAITENKGE